MSTVGVFLLALMLGLAGCAGPRLDVAPMPQRDADLYPWAVEKAGVVVAVDEIVDPDRMQQYFGVNLLEHAILPVNVVVSNRSDRRVTIGPGDVLLVQDREVIDPLPIARVAHIAEGAGGDETDMSEHLAALVLQETTLAANQSYQGVLFFPYERVEDARDDGPLRTILRLFGHDLRMNIGVTDASTGERLYFGPFRLAAGKDVVRDFLGATRLLGD